jgi:hypothetical protein
MSTLRITADPFEALTPEAQAEILRAFESAEGAASPTETLPAPEEDAGATSPTETLPAPEEEATPQVEAEPHHRLYRCNALGGAPPEEGEEEAEEETTCWGCAEGQPNQQAHMEPGGCCYVEDE